MPLLSRTSQAADPSSRPGAFSGPILRLGKTPPPAGAVVTVPGSQIPLLRLELPPGLRGQAREQVARRQLADRTGLSPDSLSLRPFLPQTPAGQRSPKNRAGKSWTQVLVGDSPYLQSLQAISCRAVLPDYLTLPVARGIWTLTLEQIPAPEAAAGSQTAPTAGSVLLARLGPEDGFSALPAIALAMLQQALAAGTPERPQAILWTGPAETPVLTEVETLARAHDIALIHSPKEATALGLPHPQAFAHGELACDLRHNPMAARAQLSARVLPWRWPLLAGCLAALLWAAGERLQISRLEAAIQTQEARNQALVKSHFVPDGPVLDARLQVSRALSSLRQGSGADSGQADPLELTARLAEVITRGAASPADRRPELLSYRAPEGLLLALRLKDFAAADQLAAELRQAGLTTKLTDSRVNEAESGVRAEFVITGFAAAEPQPLSPQVQP
ncbi:type II secretion system protein GspL [Pseudophaeobacter sp.]|uniref:type II secretion system protein GspL n=1 Tax=Pseudophaeobacter sp. TaxID=1971739 RepID=UPI003296967D